MSTGFGLRQAAIGRFCDAISCWPQLHIYREIGEHFDSSSSLGLPVPSDSSYALYFRTCRSRRSYPGSSSQYWCYLRASFAYMSSCSCHLVRDHSASFVDSVTARLSGRNCCSIIGGPSKCYYSKTWVTALEAFRTWFCAHSSGFRCVHYLNWNCRSSCYWWQPL